jgi:hypothetical protein
MSSGGSAVRRHALFILALFLAANTGFALQAPRMVPRRLMLAVTRPQGSLFTAGDALMIIRSLHQRIQDADGKLVVVEASEMLPLPDSEAIGAAARAAGTDGWMLLTLDGQWTSARLGIRVVDLLSNSTVADTSATRTSWTSPASLPGETWADVVEAVAGKFPMVESAALPAAEEQLARLMVTALPGSVVTGLGAAPMRIDANGSALRMLPTAREYSLRTTLPGYMVVTQKIFLSGDRQLVIEQKKSPRWGLDVSLSDSRAPGMDITMSFPSRSLFARLGVTTYALALALSQTEVFLSDPLTNVELRAGIYLSPEDRFFRFYAGLGGFARIVHAKDTSPMFDPVAPLGFMFLLGAEVPVSARGRLFFEYTPSMYLTNIPDTLRASLGSDDLPGWLFASSEGFNLLSFRIGYRWPL